MPTLRSATRRTRHTAPANLSKLNNLGRRWSKTHRAIMRNVANIQGRFKRITLKRRR